jgi:hypothetical protein
MRKVERKLPTAQSPYADASPEPSCVEDKEIISEVLRFLV